MTTRLVVNHYEDWLLPGSSDDSRLLHADPSDRILLYPSHVGQGYRQYIPLRDNLTLVIMDYVINHGVISHGAVQEPVAKFEFPITDVSGQVSRFLPSLNSTYVSAICPNKHVFEIEVIFKGYDSTWRYGQACIERFPRKTQQIIERTIQAWWRSQGGRSGLDPMTIINRLSTYAMQGSLIADQDFALEYVVPEALYAESIELEYANRQPITTAMESLIGQILTCPYHGETRRKYLERKSLELVQRRIQAISQPSLPLSELDCVYQAAAVLRREIVSPPTVEELARKVRTNRLKLNQGFHQVYGTTPMQYLRDCRLALAQRLLMISELSVEQVAAAVGYSSRNYFARAFRQRAGLNPKVFQMQLQMQLQKKAS